MERIRTKEEIEKKENRKKFIIGAILVGLMLVSTAGYAFFQNDKTTGSTNKITYKGVNFLLQSDGLWYASTPSFSLVTSSNPIDAGNITISGLYSIASYNGKDLYFSYDSDRESVSEITKNIGNYIGRTQFACIDNCKEDLPIKNCSLDNIILIQISNESLIRQDRKCVYIEGDTQNIVKASDAFIFKLFGL